MTFDTGRAFKLALAILKRDAVKLVPLAALLVGLPDAASTYLIGRFTRTEEGFAHANTWIVIAASLLVSMLSTVSLQAITTHRFEKNRRSVSDPVRRDTIGVMFDVVALGLVTSLGILAGFVLLIIPGIILSLAWFVAVPAMVTERLGVLAAIRRSNTLTGNARGAIFGLAFAVGVVGYLFSWLTQLAANAADSTLVNAIVGPVVQTLLGLVNAALTVAVYDELRWSQEGAREDDLKAIFS